MTKEEIIRVIAAATEPRRMSKQEAYDFMSHILEDLQMSMDALREEIDAEEE